MRARSSTKTNLGSQEQGRAGGKAKDCESMPHRPAVDVSLELSSLAEVPDTGHGCGRIECGDLISTISAVPRALFYSLCILSHGNLPLTNVPVAEQCHRPGAVKSRTTWARFCHVNGILVWGEGLAFCILETPIN